MLNGAGGRVLIGVTPEGRVSGQAISDKTLREVADVCRKFEPPATIAQTRVNVGGAKEVLVLEAIPNPEQRPYVFDGRPTSGLDRQRPSCPKRPTNSFWPSVHTAGCGGRPSSPRITASTTWTARRFFAQCALASSPVAYPSPPGATFPTSWVGWGCSKKGT